MSAATATPQFRIARRVGRSLIERSFCLVAEGLDRIPRGNYILAANHLGRLDPFLILATLPPQPRIHFLAAWETARDSPWKRFLNTYLGGVIPVRRGRGALDADAIRAVVDVLEDGGIVALFPEGAYGRVEGRLRRPLRHGAAHFAFASGRPILPVGLGGTSYLHWDRRFVVRIGQPIEVERQARPSDPAIRRLTDTVADALERLIEPAPPPPVGARGAFLNRLLGRPGRFGASFEVDAGDPPTRSDRPAR